MTNNCKRLCITIFHGVSGGGRNDRKGLYEQGFKFCKRCNIYFNTMRDAHHCKCCGNQLRVRARHWGQNKKNRDMRNVTYH